jgi:hypothetical protein
MEETLTRRCRVTDEGQKGCKGLLPMKIMTLIGEKAPANFVPAAAVIRRERVLFGMTGRKGCVGRSVSET